MEDWLSAHGDTLPIEVTGRIGSDFYYIGPFGMIHFCPQLFQVSESLVSGTEDKKGWQFYQNEISRCHSISHTVSSQWLTNF